MSADSALRLPPRSRPIFAALEVLGCIALAAPTSAQRNLRPLSGNDVTTTIDFEDQAPGTRVTAQYHAQGVDFLDYNVSSPEGGLIPDIATAGAGVAHSGTQVLNTYQRFGEFFTSWTGGAFTTTVSSVSMRVGFVASGAPGDVARVRLRVRDASHVQVGEAEVVVTEGAGFHTLLSVASASANIAYFVVETAPEDSDDAIGIDDLSFTHSAGATPDFALSAPAGLTLLRGSGATLPVGITRFNGSSGPIQFTLTGLPEGVTGSFTPNPADASTSLSLSASTAAAPTPGVLVSIVGTPLIPEAGTQARSTTTFLVVEESFTVSVQPSELTLPRCASVEVRVEVRRNLGFAGSVELRVTGLPFGVHGSFDPGIIDFHDGGAVGMSQLTLRSGNTTPLVADRDIQILGLAAGSPSSVASATLSVVDGSTSIRVVDEHGAQVPGAEVYVASFSPSGPHPGHGLVRNGIRMGITDDSGSLPTLPLPAGAALVARKRVFENGSPRGDHTGGGDNGRPWSYHAYQTSLEVDDDGLLVPFVVTDPCAPAELTLRARNSLIGLHVVASLNWDASAAEIDATEQTLREASTYLYNATDGQFLMERIEIADAGAGWEGCDYRVNVALNFDNGIRAHVDWPRGGFLDGGSWMHVSRVDDGATLAHEFGHYAFGCGDEYEDAPSTTHCTEAVATGVGPYAAGQPAAACMMWSQWGAPKLCSSHPSNPHIGGHRQEVPCWQSIRSRFDHFSLWRLRSPDAFSRGALVGTVNGRTIPAPGWVDVIKRNGGYPVLCSPILFRTEFDGEVRVADVHSTQQNGSLLWHGNTNNLNGLMEVHGVHIGETILAIENAFFPRYVERQIGPGDCVGTVRAQEEEFALQLVPSAFQVLASIASVDAGATHLRIEAARGWRPVELSSPPEVRLSRAPSLPPEIVPVVHDAGSRSWIASVENAEPSWQGSLTIRAVNAAGETSMGVASLGLSLARAAEDTEVFSPDGHVSMTLSAGVLADDALVAVGPSARAWPVLPPGFVVVGKPYAVQTSHGQVLERPCNLRFQLPHAEDVVGTAGLEAGSLAIWRYDESRGSWLQLGGQWVPAPIEVITARVSELGDFALIAHVERPAAGPDCTEAVATLPLLWPPNHRWVDVGVDGVRGASAIEILRVTSTEPSSGRENGDPSPDAILQGATARLRAERSGSGLGRLYRIHFRATDADGRSAEGSVTACVPHDASRPCIDDGNAYDATAVAGVVR